jgi:hypothetical protein
LSRETAGGPTADRARPTVSACVAFGILLLVSPARAQTPDSLPPPGALKRLSLEQLMDVEVTSVSRRPEKLSTTASAIQIITGDDIRRSGASSIPEALRLAPNLQVAQVSSSQWAVSARGFNNTLANKLLVLVDGRTIYTPLYAGVFWDVQNLPLDAVDRIEVVSGPGGTLWGANAVNGVINIITRHAQDTQGLLVEGGAAASCTASERCGTAASPPPASRIVSTVTGSAAAAPCAPTEPTPGTPGAWARAASGSIGTAGRPMPSACNPTIMTADRTPTAAAAPWRGAGTPSAVGPGPCRKGRISSFRSITTAPGATSASG